MLISRALQNRTQDFIKSTTDMIRRNVFTSLGSLISILISIFTNMRLLTSTFVLLLGLAFVSGQWDPHWLPNRSGMVHLFEWKWSDIAKECEDYLAPHGYGGVQISPPTENTAIELEWLSTIRPWWER